ncbi:hypothetical protein [Cochleicola gelatinilyticus]|uniref:Uncharacterized protein n=1 Tax=Cochleicola gelatinilyticus TaxID=1763537 RepID=A0A167KA73_9FLAO|nr:hypothetical protein [Cochleicola gelatinilyticus]OAB81553.1 hypothetical protein ULVI_01665 [Cochleicola gelatinilyticus]
MIEKLHKNKYDFLRMILGIIFLGYSVFSIFNIISYTEYAYDVLNKHIPNDILITVGASFIPFLAFFSGLQLLLNTSVRRSIQLALIIVSVLAIATLVGQLYPLSIGCGLVLIGLAELGRKFSQNRKNRSELN